MTVHGIFGLGCNLSLPSITRKTDKGLPRYWDAEESDVFILSGAEDLVPVLKLDGTVDETTRNGYCIRQYRPRIEGLFARIERWTKLDSEEAHWRSISKDNITTLYGKTAESRIADSDRPTNVLSWLICESYDDKGNAIHYKYEAENSNGIVIAQAHERNRTLESRSVNRYLKRIKYGNQTPRQPGEDLSIRTDWLFEVVFDYGEHYISIDIFLPYVLPFLPIPQALVSNKLNGSDRFVYGSILMGFAFELVFENEYNFAYATNYIKLF